MARFIRRKRRPQGRHKPAAQSENTKLQKPDALSPHLAARIEKTKGHGKPLSTDIQASLKPHFGPKIDQVRVHDHTESHRLSERLNANAFTLGNDVFFNKGQFKPKTAQGSHLLAHEVAHTQQPFSHKRIQRQTKTAPKVNPNANALLGAVPLKDRKKLTISTMPVVPQNLNLGTNFDPKVKQVIPNLKFGFGKSLSPTLQHGLKNIATNWVSGKILKPNQTLQVQLDLTRHKGDKGLYRFTYLKTKVKKKVVHKVLIEHMGTLGSGGFGPGEKAKAYAKISRHDIKVSNKIVGSQKEHDLLLHSILRMPDHLLAKIKGVEFTRDSAHANDPKAGGIYDEDNHRIVLYDKAFGVNLTRTGSVKTPTEFAIWAIVHEMGHAIDKHELRKKELAYFEIQKKFNALIPKFNAAKGKLRRQLDKQLAKLNRQLKKAKKEYLALRSESGEYTRVIKGSFSRKFSTRNKTPFRKTTIRESKVRITEYANKNWQETFAESFSAYINDPETLKLLRPKLYQYLNKKYKKYP